MILTKTQANKFQYLRNQILDLFEEIENNKPNDVNTIESVTDYACKIFKVKAKDLKLDDQFADDDGKTLKVISPYNSISTPNPNDVENIVLVQGPDQKNDPIALDPETEIQVEEGRLSKIASRKGKKLKIKDLKGKIKYYPEKD